MINKQRIVRLAKFSSLTFSLVSGLSMAQQQLPSQLVSGNSGAGNVNTVAANDVITQPVVVTPSMAPVQAPVADSVNSGIRAGQDGVSISATPSTGIGGANTGNANTGGLQVQNVTVQANPEAKSTSLAINSGYEAAEMLRQRRVRREVENETRLLERLEEGRLKDERSREGSIEDYQSSVAGSTTAVASASAYSNDLQTVPVVQTGASAIATASVGEASMLSTEGKFLGMSSFSLAPFAGYRWFDNNFNSAYRARNVGTAGLLFEGKFNQYLSFEGTFTYGRDNFLMNQVAYGYYGNIGTGESRDTFEVSGGLRVSKTFSNSFTPYIAGSLGGMFSKYNIDNLMVGQGLSQAGLMRSTTQAIGNIGAGMDIRVAQNFSIGGRFDYQASLGNRDSNMFDFGQSSMNSIWNDQANRYRLTGSLQLVF